MNVLLIYPKFQFSFWSLPKASRLTGTKSPFYPLGLITMAALLPREWDVRLVDQNTSTLAEKDWGWADIVMISAMYLQQEGLLRLTREAKERGKIVVAGGPYPTSLSDDVMAAGCDFVVRGEAENSLPVLIDAVKEGRRQEVIENNLKPEMSNSPVPRFDLLRLNNYKSLSLQTSRGCPFDCEFCDVVNLYGRKPRYKDPEQVIEELEALYQMGARGHVFICDDNFIGNKTHARAILQRLTPWNKSHGEPFGFSTQVSVNLGQDLEMIDLMTAANFGEVVVGIETPDENVLEINRKYQNLQNPLIESLNNINRNGLSVIASFIIGFDGERHGAGERICAFVEQTGVPFVLLNLLGVIPNTSLWKRLEKEGRLLENFGTGESTFASLNYIPSRPEAEIKKEYADAWDYLYDPSRYLARAYRYCLAIRPTRRATANEKKEILPPETPKSKPALRARFHELKALLLILWWQGIRPSFRGQFWRQLIAMWKQNPSRIRKYIVYCATGEDMFYLKKKILKMAVHPQDKSVHCPQSALTHKMSAREQ